MSRLVNWIDARLPVKEAFRKHASQYPIPKNINIWWLFGSLSLLMQRKFGEQEAQGVMSDCFFKK